MIELTGLTIGDKVLLRSDTGDTITVKHNDVGATIKILIKDDSDFILNEQHPLELILVATNELAQSDDGDLTSEGTWTPAVTGVSVLNSRGYSQISGNMVTLMFSFTMPVTASGSTFVINNVPFTSAAAGIGKPIAYYGLVTKTGFSIDNRLEFPQNTSAMIAVSDSDPGGRALSYFSAEIVMGSITYVKA